MSKIVNALTVDVEDYFHVSAFADHIDPRDWDHLESRVARNTDSVLRIFDDHGARATFFVLGWVAERHPDLIRRIADAGHEIASHGFSHKRVHEQSAEEFRADIRRTKSLLEDIGGGSVQGYRAASFSISDETRWAFEILAEEGYLYSSSLYPIRHDHYGSPDSPRFAHRPLENRTLIEIPVSTTVVFDRNFPCGGGGYFRLLPYEISRWAMRRVNRADGEPCIFYFHPWEIDTQQPRQTNAGRKARFRHYTNLHRMEGRLRRVLDDFDWDRMDRIFVPLLAGAA